MYYLPVNANYYPLPATYVPIYSTLIEQRTPEYVPRLANNDLSRVENELKELRGELKDLRLEKAFCSICSSASRANRWIEDCSICSPRPRASPVRQTYSPPPSTVHYCSLCAGYVIDLPYPPSASVSAYCVCPYRAALAKSSEYLSRQIDLAGLHHRYVPEMRPAWIPTAYKQDYPHRRWIARHSYLSDP